MNLYIFDLDGTLANNSHRAALMPLLQDETWHWDEYNRACGGDKPIEPMVKLLQDLVHRDICFIVTSRCEVARTETLKWLEDNEIPYDGLIMRKEGNNRSDERYKIAAFNHIKDQYPEYNIVAFDDDLLVVNALRNEGYTVLKCV